MNINFVVDTISNCLTLCLSNPVIFFQFCFIYNGGTEIKVDFILSFDRLITH
jgi:hypothetical protein